MRKVPFPTNMSVVQCHSPIANRFIREFWYSRRAVLDKISTDTERRGVMPIQLSLLLRKMPHYLTNHTRHG